MPGVTVIIQVSVCDSVADFSLDIVKSFLGHKTHKLALISVSLARYQCCERAKLHILFCSLTLQWRWLFFPAS